MKNEGNGPIQTRKQAKKIILVNIKGLFGSEKYGYNTKLGRLFKFN